MPRADGPPTPIDAELAVLVIRLRAAQRDALAALTAAGSMVALLTQLGGWPVL